MIRSTTSASYDILKGNFTDIQAEYQKRQIQASTGKAYMDRSENITDASMAAEITREKEDTIQYQNNVRDANAQIMTTDSQVQDLIELLQEASELATSAGNGTHPPEYRMDVAQELNGIIDQIFSISETKFGDKYLFGGTQTSQPPFTATRDADGEITAITSNADADTELLKTQMNESTIVDYGLLASGTDGVFSDGGAVNIIENLIAIRDELALGNAPADADTDQLQDNMDHVIGKLTTNAVKQQWFESQERRLSDIELTQNIQLEELQGADLAAVMTELAQLQTTYQATMQMINKTSQLSIINYI